VSTSLAGCELGAGGALGYVVSGGEELAHQHARLDEGAR
jgi:hypothetical protein